jgi:hypothetical protein
MYFCASNIYDVSNPGHGWYVLVKMMEMRLKIPRLGLVRLCKRLVSACMEGLMSPGEGEKVTRV